MENKLSLSILDLYSKNPFTFYSINEISKQLGKRYPYINKRVNDLIKCNVFSKTVIGKSHLCSLNLHNDRTIAHLALNQINKKQELEQREQIDTFISSIKPSVSLHCVVKAKDSIVFVLDYLQDKKHIEQGFENATVIGKDTFLEKLKAGSLFEDYTVLYGYERFFEFLKDHEQELKEAHSPLA